MAGFNLPPGVSVNDIPGNRPEDDEPDETKPAFWSVSIHMVDRHYGGPEEGGWYYDFGYPICEILDEMEPEYCLPKSFLTWGETVTYSNLLEDKLSEGPNKGRRDIGSVLSAGIYRAIIQEGYPHSWPTKRPYYE